MKARAHMVLTAMELDRRGLSINPSCQKCNEATEDITHIFKSFQHYTTI